MYLNNLKNEANYTSTENGAKTYISTQSDCLDLFATIGALRQENDQEVLSRFYKAFAENRDLAMKILFYARDIRGGLGERKVFRTIISDMANRYPKSVKKNIPYISEYGRWDDILSLLHTDCEKEAVELISKQLSSDLKYALYRKPELDKVSLIAKWLPSTNTSSKQVSREGKYLAKKLCMKESNYRRLLSSLRKEIRIIENNLRKKDYTFDYSKQPSKAMLKYRKAFIRNDGERYAKYLEDVASGKKTLHTGTLYPYDIVRTCFGMESRYEFYYSEPIISEEERQALDVSWNALEDFTNGENSMVILDGSGSMYCDYGAGMRPCDVAMSLAIYFAERSKGAFHNHFITFSSYPQVVEIKGKDIYDKVRYCAEYDDCSNTDLQKTFELLLNTAVEHHVPQEELPKTLYIISDMEFDCCYRADITNFEYAKKIFKDAGYKLPNVVFWNVCSRSNQQPITKNEQGAVLVSGASPRIFQMVISGETDPYKYMESVILTERYEKIKA